MIRSYSNNTTIANVEHVLVSGKVASTDTTSISVTLFRENLTEAEKAIYDAAINVASVFKTVLIENTDSSLDIDRMTSSPLTEDEGVLDWSAMSTEDKDKLLQFLTLIVAKNTQP